MSDKAAQREALDEAACRLCMHCHWEQAWRNAKIEAKSSLVHVSPGNWKHQFANGSPPHTFRDCDASVIHELAYELQARSLHE